MRVPGFSAEASLYRTRSYREMRVDGVRDAFEAVEAAQSRAARERPAIIVLDFHFQTPWHNCACSREWGDCTCTPRPILT